MENDILQQVYDKYTKKVYLYLYSLCHNHALAEDLMQETFVKALLSVDVSEEEILPWLFRVARNLYIDVYRKECRRSFDEPDENQPCEDVGMLERLIQDERNRQLYRAILRLSEMEKEAVILYWFSGLSQEEVGRLLQLSHGNVRVILYRAKKKLKKYMEQESI